MKGKMTWTMGLLAALILTGCGQQEAPATQASAETTTQAATVETTSEPTQPAALLDLEDGVYIVDFQTDSRMFQANEAHDRKGKLTVENGQGMLHISLGSKNIVNLYRGLAADAQEDPDNWIQPTNDTVTYPDGLTEEVNGFDVPVPAVGEEFDLALIGKKGIWYDHKVSVENPVPQTAQSPALEDGRYLCAVTLSGGSGRASVESPASLTVEAGQITATIRWSSPHYIYMVVDGVQYDPIQTEGNATFAIPVVLGQDMDVIACTAAMSQPHEVEYTLHFDPATVEAEG